MDTEKYNGWKNYETWNVALWIQNDEGLYKLAKSFHNWPKPYRSFIDSLNGFYPLGEARFRTPDGVAWNDSGLDIDALNELIEEL